MILDSEQQKQNLISLLKLVPFQGNLSQGIDKLVNEVMDLIMLIEKAKIQELVK